MQNQPIHNMTTLSPEIEAKLKELTQSYEGWSADLNETDTLLGAFTFRDKFQILRRKDCAQCDDYGEYELQEFWSGVPVLNTSQASLAAAYGRLWGFAIQKANDEFLALTK